MHSWGDEDVDFQGINDAAKYIGQGLRKWRVPVRDYKEKYGTVRIYLSVGWYSIHDITHPGYAYIQYKPGSLLYWLNYSETFGRIFRMVNYIVRPLHIFLYRRYYRKAVEKWPHLREEILCCADFPEYLEGLGYTYGTSNID